MAALEITTIPVPLELDSIRTYTKSVHDAKLTARFTTADLSRKAKDLLGDCCRLENLGAPVPNFLEIHKVADSAAIILARPVMASNSFTLPVHQTKRVIRVELAPLLTERRIQTVRGTRLAIPVSIVTLPDWGSALLLHLGALQWVPIRRQDRAVPDQAEPPQP